MLKCVCMMVVPALLLTVTTGCQTMVPISASSMDPIEGLNATPVNVLQEVTDARKKKTNQVGRHTFTVFMIPTIPVFEENSLHKGVGEALSSALNQLDIRLQLLRRSIRPMACSERADRFHAELLVLLAMAARPDWRRAKMTPVLFDNEGNVYGRASLRGMGVSVFNLHGGV